MKKILYVVYFLLAAFVWAEELPEIEYDKLLVGDEQTLEVMTWNIQNFPKSEFAIDYAAEIINAIDPDVIGLQEMESDSAFFCLVKQLNDLDKHNWSGYRANRNYWKQELAFIYKTDLIGVDKIYEIFYGDYKPFPRSPLVMEFSYNDQEVVIINNHFKARTGTKNEKRRRDAVDKLDEYILENHPDANVIVLGDMNDQLVDEGTAMYLRLFWKNLQNTNSLIWKLPKVKVPTGVIHTINTAVISITFSSPTSFMMNLKNLIHL